MDWHSNEMSNWTRKRQPAPIEDTFSEFLDGTYKVLCRWQRHWRAIGREPEPRSSTTIHTINETIDKSVFERWGRDPSYRPENLKEWAARRGIDPKDLATSVTADASMATVVD